LKNEIINSEGENNLLKKINGHYNVRKQLLLDIYVKVINNSNR